MKAVRFIAPFARGGATDLVARLYADALADALGLAVTIDNEPGAGGTLGAARVARAAPDGGTLLMGTSSTHGIAAAVFGDMPYDWAHDFTPIAPLVLAPNVLVVPALRAIDSVADLVSAARDDPGALAFGSAGFGQTIHLCAELFKAITGIDITHAPRPGSAVALEELARGELDLMFDNVLSALPYIRSGKLRALAVTGASRCAQLPEVPTMVESGVPEYDLTVWIGVLGPAGLPEAVTKRLAEATQAVLEHPVLYDRLTDMGAEPLIGSPAAFTQLMASEAQKWARAVARSGVHAARPGMENQSRGS
jgi:tripartite-type tricarboxylate transporter receptor subunit TctC